MHQGHTHYIYIIKSFAKANNMQNYRRKLSKKLSKSINKLTAGEDQLPQDSANVTNGSDNSSP